MTHGKTILDYRVQATKVGLVTLTIELSDSDATLLMQIVEWCGGMEPTGELVGACIARAHDDLVTTGILRPVREGVEPSPVV